MLHQQCIVFLSFPMKETDFLVNHLFILWRPSLGHFKRLARNQGIGLKQYSKVVCQILDALYFRNMLRVGAPFVNVFGQLSVNGLETPLPWHTTIFCSSFFALLFL